MPLRRQVRVRPDELSLVGGRGGAPWAHDYPRGEEHFLKILTSISNVDAHVNESSIMSFGDPELFKFPVTYLVEPGFWNMTRAGRRRTLRDYLLKGGFLIVDDFPQRGVGQLRAPDDPRVPGGASGIDLTPTHPIFHSFFEINSLDIVPPAYNLGDAPRIHGAVRGQRSEQADARDRQLPERPVGVLGVFRDGALH